MNTKLLTKLLVLGMLLANPLFGQQDPMYTYYMYNTQAVNPAYAGSREALTLTALTRLQWVNFPGRPATHTLTMHTPLNRQRFGIGATVTHDVVALTKLTNAQADFAFRIPVSRHGVLAMGLKGSLGWLSEDFRQLDIREPGDIALSSNFQSRMIPNIGAGLYLQHDTYYLGFSVPELLEGRLRDNLVTSSIAGLKQRHYYAIAGAVFQLKHRVQFKPSAMVKYTANAPVQIDLTGNLIFRDRLIVGMMYRHAEAVGLQLGFNFTEQLFLGYGYDWSFANLSGRFNGGSHEFALRYDFLFRNSKGTRSPRYF